MVGIDVPPIVIVLFFVGVMLVLGTILDSTSIMLLTMPIMVPVVLKLGYDIYGSGWFRSSPSSSGSSPRRSAWWCSP